MAEQGNVGVAPDGTKKRDEDGDDAMEFSPFWGIEKGAVLQEARCFNDSQLDARRCQQVRRFLLLQQAPSPPPHLSPPYRFCKASSRSHVAFSPLSSQVITKLLYLCNQGDTFTKVREKKKKTRGSPIEVEIEKGKNTHRAPVAGRFCFARDRLPD